MARLRADGLEGPVPCGGRLHSATEPTPVRCQGPDPSRQVDRQTRTKEGRGHEAEEIQKQTAHTLCRETRALPAGRLPEGDVHVPVGVDSAGEEAAGEHGLQDPEHAAGSDLSPVPSGTSSNGQRLPPGRAQASLDEEPGSMELELRISASRQVAGEPRTVLRWGLWLSLSVTHATEPKFFITGAAPARKGPSQGGSPTAVLHRRLGSGQVGVCPWVPAAATCLLEVTTAQGR